MEETTAKLITAREGPVLVMTISNPAVRNALHPCLYPAALEALRSVSGDRTIRAVILTGEGEHFCGGGDVRRLERQRLLPLQSQSTHLDALHAWILAMRQVPQPVIAAVEGAAAGGGFSLALGCDLVVAADDAKFAMTYAKLALTPDGGSTDSLTRALPVQTALEMLLDADAWSAQRLHELGLVNRVVPHGGALQAALAWARRLADGPAEAQASIKRLVHSARDRGRAEQMNAERDAFVESLYSAECGTRISRFLSRRG